MKSNNQNLSENPLFEPSPEFNEAIPFDKVRPEHFLPAVKAAIAEAEKNLEAIRNNNADPNFENTILAFEMCLQRLKLIMSISHIYEDNEADEEIERLSQSIRPLVTRFSNDAFLDKKIFQKIKKVYKKRRISSLTPEQIKLTEYYYKRGSRYGASLISKKQKIISKINEELTELSRQFSMNVRKSANNFELAITDKERLRGLPESVKDKATFEAKQKGKPEGSYLFTLDSAVINAVIRYADDRSLREEIYRAYCRIAFKDKFDNSEIIKKIINLRYEKARLLGYRTYAEYILANRMAKTPKNVWQFLDELYSYAKPAAEKDLDELSSFAKEIGCPEKLEHWDIGYYFEKLRKNKFDYNSEDIRPYLKLENVINGVFQVAEKLYGIKFYPVSVSVYNSDVKTFEARDEDNRYLGLLYLDLFSRPTKQNGAWMMTIKQQGYDGVKNCRPHAGLFCNFAKPVPGKPSILTLNEAYTLFHEFGYALHLLLSDCEYQSLSGTNVLWDFVELPSQIMENWLIEKEVLDLFAFHYETGEKIPADMIEKIKKAKNFRIGWVTLRQLAVGYLDMSWHDQDPSNITDIIEFEQQALQKTELIAPMNDSCISSSFSHIFDGGYAAGYYSYKYAEVLEADSFELFKEKGIFDRQTSKSFRENILSRGNTEHPTKLYKKFRGRMPKIDALLKRNNFKKS